MEYLLAFFEGFLAFISPCVLPLLPLYITYMGGNIVTQENADERSRKQRVLRNAIGFVVGFTVVFVLLGAAAGSIGKLLNENLRLLNIIGGFVLILFGLNFAEVIRLPFINRSHTMEQRVKPNKFLHSVVFGMVFGISWSPCIGTFLGLAMMLAANAATTGKGVLMLLLFCLGMGLPFVLSAILLERLQGAFRFIKRHYKVITGISGVFLIIMGLLMMTGLLNTVIGMLV